MLRRLLKPLSSTFCSQPFVDPLQSIRSKYTNDQHLLDYQYTKLIQDMLRKKQSLSAYNLLVHSYLNNVLLDKQIFSKIQKSLGQEELTYKDVLRKMYSKYFDSGKDKQQTTTSLKTKEYQKQELMNKIKQQDRKLSSLFKEESLNKLLNETKLIKDGEVFFSSLLTKVDFQKISFKNIKINFDYEWINHLNSMDDGLENNDKFPSSEKQSKGMELEDDEEQVEEQGEEEDDTMDQEISIQDIIRSIKSIDIGEIQIVTGKNK